ncbi:MAG TPA: hypothetical protein VFI26_10145, partial [Lysobacter sp.]|nr:hypothetical protein [Lysobacter sp.]
ELLISGVAVFAMLQLPGWLDDRYFSLLPRFDSGWHTPLFMTYVYLKGATVILAITFALHLLLRAQWIAQVGMHSVFPEGIRWERMRIGPLMREIERNRYGSAEASIERADNRATVVFAIGVMLASSLLLLGFLLPALFALVMLLLWMFGIHADPSSVFTITAVVFILPAFFAQRIDRRFGHRLKTGGLLHAAISKVIDAYSRIGLMSRSSSPVFSLLASHGGELRAMMFTLLIVGATMAGVWMSTNALQDRSVFGDYAAFPTFADGSRTVDSSHYDDQRDAAHDAPTAYIQSAVVAGPYARLTVPYDPQRDTAAMRGCAIPAGTDDARAAARLDCLQSLHGVTLDGKPLPGPRYELGSDPRTDRPALVAMIDVRELPRGRHELQIAYPPKDGKAGRIEPGFDRIPFWR